MKQLMVLIITVSIVMSSYTGNEYKKESESNIGSFISIEKETTSKNEETRIDVIRIFLQKNKVFFEIFSSVLLGVMSIIISVVGTQINNKTKKIYKKQLEILENDREPYFVLECKKLLLPRKKYILKNTGGRISCVSFEINLYFEIRIWGHSLPQNYNFIVYVLPHSKLFYQKKLKYYDAKNKKSVFYELNTDKIINLKKYIEDKIKKNFSINIMKNQDVYVKVYDIVKIWISYINYKNEYYARKYEIRDGGITRILQNNNYTYSGAIYIHDIDDIDDDYIEDYIKDKIEDIMEKIQKEIQSKKETSD